MKRDPVCGMLVDEHAATTTLVEKDGEVVAFCSRGCRERYLRGDGGEGDEHTRDVVIVGGGPAGLTAAVFASTMKMDALLLARDLGGQAVDSTVVENYMGYEMITGPQLVERFTTQLVHSNWLAHELRAVERIERTGDGFRLVAEGSRTYASRAVILATGMTRRRLDVPGCADLVGLGVDYGNVRDPGRVAGEDVVVVGGGNSALQVVDRVLAHARTVHVVSDFPLSGDASWIERIAGDDRVHRHEGFTVESFEGDEWLAGVRIRRMAGTETVTLPARQAFVCIGMRANGGLVADLADCNDRGEVVVDSRGATSCPGLFAAGDVTDAFGKRIIIAAGDGARAGLAARKFLLERTRAARKAATSAPTAARGAAEAARDSTRTP